MEEKMIVVIKFKSDGELYMLRPEHAAVFIKLKLAEVL